MYKKVLYNIKKNKQNVGGGAIKPKPLNVFLKKKKTKKSKQKKLTQPGLEPTTSGLEKPALLSTRLNTIKVITKYE